VSPTTANEDAAADEDHNGHSKNTLSPPPLSLKQVQRPRGSTSPTPREQAHCIPASRERARHISAFRERAHRIPAS
jgi:hypothetical protein